jgi:PAS domain-containing protein
MVGYSREDLASGRLRWDAITPAEYAPGDASMRADLQREGRAGPREKEYIRKDGSRVPVPVGARAIMSCPAIMTGMVCCCTGVTSVKPIFSTAFKTSLLRSNSEKYELVVSVKIGGSFT